VVEAELAERGVRAALVEGRGSEMPVASNADEAGRERNRRVEVWLAEGP
jgi:phosphate transport system substrate-binding protein